MPPGICGRFLIANALFPGFGLKSCFKYLCRSMQIKPTKITSISCIFLMLTLSWLTVSLPFLYSSQQTMEQAGGLAVFPSEGHEEETENPFANTTEEKTPNSITATEEYLHDIDLTEQYLTAFSLEYKVEHVSTYIAFYGELISPPPDVC